MSRRRAVARNGRVAAASERRWAGINEADEVGPRSDAGQRIIGLAVLLVEIFELEGRGCGEFSASGKTHDADLIWIDAPLF